MLVGWGWGVWGGGGCGGGGGGGVGGQCRDAPPGLSEGFRKKYISKHHDQK